MNDRDRRDLDKIFEYHEREIISTEEACKQIVFFKVGREPARAYFAEK
jgi:hypothetical protein